MPTQVIEEFNAFGRIADEFRPAAGRVVKTTIYRIEARWKASLSGARSGRTYRRGAIRSRRKANKGEVIGYKFHRASAPGEPPATDTGNLANSIYAQMVGELTGEVGSTAAYAPVLEMGGAHMAARPSLGPAVKAEWPEFESAMERMIERTAREAGAKDE